MELTPAPQGMPPMGGMPPAGGMPPEMGGQQPISDQQYQDLQDLLSSVKEQEASISSNQFVIDNEGEQAMRDAVKHVFDSLAAAGVDLNDQASVAEFLTNLQNTNPDIYELFEQAMAQLLGGNPMMNEEPIPGVPEDLRGPEGPELGADVLPPELSVEQPPEGGLSIPLP